MIYVLLMIRTSVVVHFFAPFPPPIPTDLLCILIELERFTSVEISNLEVSRAEKLS